MVSWAFHPLAGLRSVIPLINRLLCGACEPGTGPGTTIAVVRCAGRDPRGRREVGTMAYLAMGIAFIVLEIIAAVKTLAGHA